MKLHPVEKWFIGFLTCAFIVLLVLMLTSCAPTLKVYKITDVTFTEYTVVAWSCDKTSNSDGTIDVYCQLPSELDDWKEHRSESYLGVLSLEYIGPFENHATPTP